MSELINGDLLYALKVYNGKVDGYDSLHWRNLLFRKKLKSGGRHGRLGELSL